jgi:hypothetical protein
LRDILLHEKWEISVRTLEALFDLQNRQHIGTSPRHYATRRDYIVPCQVCWIRYNDYLKARNALAWLEPSLYEVI